MADKCIGKLTLDITDVEKKIADVNAKLKGLGVGFKVNISSAVAKEVKKQLKAVEDEIDKAVKNIQASAQRASNAFNGVGSGATGTLQGEITKTTSLITNLGRSVDASGKTIEVVIGETRTGLNALGIKMKEVTDASGNITKKVVDMTSQYKEATKIMTEYYSKSAQLMSMKADGKTGTPQYAKTVSEVNALNEAWSKIPPAIQTAAAKTEEAQRAAQLYANTIRLIQQGITDKNVEEALKNQANLWQMYYKYISEAGTYAQKGNIENADMYKALADGIKSYIDAVAILNPTLDAQAQAEQKVIDAHLKAETTFNNNAFKAQTEAVNEYKNALIALYSKQTELNNAEASGRIKQGSEEYDKAKEKIDHFRDAVVDARKNIDTATAKMVKDMREVVSAADSLAQSEARLRDSQATNVLQQTESAYKSLTNAIKEYNLAEKAKNETGKNYWKEQINDAITLINKITGIVSTLNMDAETRQRILTLIEQCRTTNDAFNKGIMSGSNATSELETQMTGLLTRMFSIMAVIRTISNLINSTVEYVSEYSDKMNEIQMITLKTDEEVAELADTYRDLAAMMNVSSLDMADAAIYFTRQGLGAAEIEKRLKNVTMYAKAANVEFKDASEIITAVVNSMGLVEQEAEDGRNAAQRVADVFLKVGDSAATSGQEIGEAMQKAAASAGAFGMSFEWLASYIATVSETTRQEARTIGTALNTIIARLHQIKQQGYNSEDETKINDVQKALAKINVTLMDENNEWRDMDTIFQEIGAQWDTLDGKTKSYIATTMAGVKQQNVFLALMNDLGKENLETTEHESRAWELYAKAIDSAGTAEEKYAVYKDSVAASQERLNIAQEKFYSLLDSNVIKSWNNALAGFINILNDGAAAMNGWNIAIPAIVAALTALVAVVIKFDAIASTLMAHPVIATIGLVSVALVGLTTVISGIAAEIGSAKARFDEANQALAESRERMSELTAAQTQVGNLFADLQDGAKLTSEDLQKYNAQLEQIARVSPAAKTIVDQLKSGFIDQEEAVRKLNEEMERLIGNENKYSQVQLLKKYANWQPDETANDSMLYYLNSSWTDWTWGHEQMDNWTDAQKFAYNLKQNWMDTSSVSKMPAEVRQLIENTRKDLLQNKSLTEEKKWGIIGQLVWQEFVGTDSYSIDDALKSRAQSIVDDAINSLSAGLNPTEIKALQRNLMNMLLGEDGKMDEAEYKEIGSKMATFISGVIANGIQFSDIDMAEAVAESLFGTATEGLFAEQGEAFAKKFVDQYNAAIKAGFTDSDIAKIFAESGLPTMELDRIGEILKEALQKNIADALGKEDFLSLLDWNEKWEDADMTTLKLVNDYMDLGIEIEEIDELLANSESMDEFVEKLRRLGEAEGVVSEGSENTVKSLNDLIKEIKSYISEVEDINAVIETIKNGDEIKASDLLDIASAHPEIMAFLNDTNELINQLERIKQESKNGVVSDVRNIILGNEDVMKNSPFSEYMTDDIKTLGQYSNTLDETSADMVEVSRYVELATAQFLAATGQIDKIDVNKIKELQKILFGRSNVDLNNRPTIDASKLVDAGWSDAGDGIATVFTSSYKAGKEGIKWDENVIVSVTPILENGDVMSPDALDKYMDELFAKSGNIDELRQNDTKGLVIDVTAVADNESFADAESRVESLMVLLHKLQEVLYGKPEGEKSWLEEQVEAAAKTAELEWAKSNGYIEQIRQLQDYLGDEGVDGAASALDLWNSFDESMRKSIVDTYPGILKAMAQVEAEINKTDRDGIKLEKTAQNLGKSLENAAKTATAQNFKKTYEAIQKLEKGTISASEAFDTFYSETDKVTKAQEEINTATDKLADGVELAVSDVNDLASVLGVSADQILQDFPGAVDMFNQLISETGDLRAAFDALNEAAFIQITGVSEADFSAIMNGLDIVVDKASETVKMLEATGQWKVETIQLEGMQNVLENGKLVQKVVHGFQDVLRPTGNNPYKGTTKSNYTGSSSGKKSSGGSGSNRNNDSNSDQMTEVELMLNRMEQMQNISDFQRGYYQSQSSYYSQTGYLQGVIGANEKEIEVLEQQNKTLEKNVAKIEKSIEAKKAELATLDKSDEKYEEVRDDLDKLQKAHQDYSKKIFDNKTSLDQLNETIDETKKKIRDMVINIKNQIYQAIEDREAKKKRMFEGEISMENTILDLIKKRYEKERDLILANTDRKITALQEERDLLSEQLELRKKMADQEDKAAKLAQLEANYNRIIADPTRAKEAKEIQKQITDLRKDIAWDAAEEEVEAQQESIDQQITSLEDYKQYIEEYYEDLFEHPQKLIDEMKSIMEMTDEEIIEWLSENDENFAAATENTQRKMIEGWQQTLDDMHGKIKTYWAEVEEIYKQGDEAIIEFLKENSSEYQKAGKEQAEKYVEEWKKGLEDLHKAVAEPIVIKIVQEYEVLDPGTTGSSSTPTAGGGTTTTTPKEDHGYSFVYGGKTYDKKGFKTKDEAQKAMEARVAKEIRALTPATGASYMGEAIRAVQKGATVYAKGGLAYNTGLAWLDGTQQDPERVLSPYQTKLFETMVQALEKMSTISIPSMPNFGNLELTGSGGVNVGDIIVNVDNLDTDDDYEELAEKVSEVLMERIGRTTVVGGLRINSI